MTFHWATNYGAVLQTYALQNYLESIGHTVCIINYKPSIYNKGLKLLLRSIKQHKIRLYFNEIQKELKLEQFRKLCLKETRRICQYEKIVNVINDLDCLISGSDQVLNPSFLNNGEGTGICPAYFLEVPFKGKKIAYAVSFGCVTYPENENIIAKKYINNFCKISVRETSGLDIVRHMGRNDSVIVPDPTILMSSNKYSELSMRCELDSSNPYIYSYFIRDINDRRFRLSKLNIGYKIIWNNEDGDFSIEGWLSKINNAKYVLTDSFHCMVMCLKLHTPFVIITDEKGNIGMNDRFYTLLSELKLEDRILHKTNVGLVNNLLHMTIDWDKVDVCLDNYMNIGREFLKKI